MVQCQGDFQMAKERCVTRADDLGLSGSGEEQTTSALACGVITTGEIKTRLFTLCHIGVVARVSYLCVVSGLTSCQSVPQPQRGSPTLRIQRHMEDQARRITNV